MARVRLYRRPPNGNPTFRFIRPGGVRDAIPALRLAAYADLMSHVRPGKDAGKAAFPDCIIDTGSHLTTVPQYVWGRFKPGVVRALPFDPTMPPSLRVVTLLGGSFPYDLGELAFRLRDLGGGALDVRVVAQFVRDNGAFTGPLILGLRGGVLDGRVLRSEPDPAAQHGQAWVLEDL